MELTSPITGVAQSGLTSPTFTIAAVAAPSQNGKQYNVVALGGTQTGSAPHSVGNPFTLTLVAPSPVKQVPSSSAALSPMGYQSRWPMNTNKVITRKGVAVNGSGGTAVAICTLSMEIPAGAPDHDLVSLKSMMSALLGSYIQDPDQWWEAFLSGSI